MIQWRGRSNRQYCDGVHLVLADARHDDRVVVGEVVQPLHAVLRLEPVGFLAVAQRVFRLPLVELREPRRAVGRAGALLSLGELGRQLGDDVLAVADDRDVDEPVLPDLGGVDVHVHDLGVGRERRQLAGDAVVEARAQRDEQVGLAASR